MFDTFRLLFGYPAAFFYVSAALETSTALCLVAAPGVGTILLFSLMGGAVYSHAVRQGQVIASVFAWILMGCCLLGDSLDYFRGAPRSGALAIAARYLGALVGVQGAVPSWDYPGIDDGMSNWDELAVRITVLAIAALCGALGFAAVAVFGG